MCDVPRSILTVELFGPSYSNSTDSGNDFLSSSQVYYENCVTADNLLDITAGLPMLDHCEVVESTPAVALNESSSSNFDSSSLFSFEVETNEIPQTVLDTVDDLLTDFGWADVTDDATDLCDSPFQSLHRDDLLALTVPCCVQTTSVQTLSPITSSLLSDPNSVAHPSVNKIKMGSCPVNCHNNFMESQPDVDLYSPTAREDDLDSISESSSLENVINGKQGFLHNEDLARGIPGERLSLTLEERKLLKVMGVRMPSRFPLAKAEEKALRTVRRKIRNKLSAQASRLRRQEYLTELEQRIEMREKENKQLRLHVATLENDKRTLMAHVKKLRSYVSKLISRDQNSTLLPVFTRSKNTDRYTRTSAQTAAAGGTSLLIVTFLFLAWTALVPGPSQKALRSSPVSLKMESNNLLDVFPGRSRTLLENKNSKFVESVIDPHIARGHDSNDPDGKTEPLSIGSDAHSTLEQPASASTVQLSDQSKRETVPSLANESFASSPTVSAFRSPDLPTQTTVHSIASFDL